MTLLSDTVYHHNLELLAKQACSRQNLVGTMILELRFVWPIEDPVSPGPSSVMITGPVE